MIKMVVSSFYNTLINEEDAVPVSTMLEIERIRKKGILFTICTNRTYKEVLDYNKDFPFIDYIIFLNGSCVYDVKKERCISKNKITTANLKKIGELTRDSNVTFYGEENIYRNLDDIKEDIYKIEIELTGNENYLEEIEKRKGNYSILKKDGKEYFEITSQKSNMFTGVDNISLRNNINFNEILTITSNESDLSLINNIPNSYIVENADEILRKKTKKRTTSNINKGVETVLKKIK